MQEKIVLRLLHAPAGQKTFTFEMSSGALANGKCMMERGIYYKPWDGRVFESRYTSWIKSSEGIKCLILNNLIPLDRTK